MLLNAILRHAAREPDKAAVVSGEQGATYAVFARLILAVRAWLERSVPAGDGVVAVCGSTLLAQWITVIALRSLGRTTVVVPDLETLAGLSLPSIDAIVLPPDSGGAEGDGARAARSRLTAPIVSLPGEVLREARDNPFPLSPVDERFGDYLEYTSGTTGSYKVVRRSGASFAAECDRTIPEYGIGADTVFHLGSLVPWCAVGSKCPVTVWREGGVCLFDIRQDWLAHILDWPVDRLFLPPSLFGRLAGIAFTQRRETLRIYSGGGFLSFPAVRALRDRLGCKVFLNYGATEFGLRLQGLVENEDDVVWLSPFGEDSLEIVDDDGEACEAGREGRLRARLHPADPVGYVGNEEATRQFFRDGYFHTGDSAIRRADGRIRILGRAGDVINIAGTKQAVGPIESRVSEVLGVDGVCLFAQQSSGGEEFLLVVIEGEREPDGPRLAHVTATFRQSFPHVVIRHVAEFPRRGPLQKLDRKALLDSLRSTIRLA